MDYLLTELLILAFLTFWHNFQLYFKYFHDFLFFFKLFETVNIPASQKE